MKKLIMYSNIFLKTRKIYLITLDKSEEFAYKINEGASDMAKLVGLTYIWDAPAKRGIEEQKNVINEAVEKGADLIMLVAIDPVEISGAVADAKAQGVQIIYVDSPANEEAVVTLATNNYDAGKIAGKSMINELKSKGVFSGSIGIIGVTPELVTIKSREFGFRDEISKDGRYELLETKYAQGDPNISERAVEEFINENSDLVGLFATNEGSSVGMGYALQNSNKPIIGIGFDITNIIRDMINNEVIKAIVIQNPYTMGYLGMAEAIAALTGKNTGPNFINTGVSLVTKYIR